MWRPSFTSAVILLCTPLKSVGAGDSLLTAWTGSTQRAGCGAITFRSTRRDTVRAQRPASASRAGMLPPGTRGMHASFTAWVAPSVVSRSFPVKRSSDSRSSSIRLRRPASASSASRTTPLPGRACPRRQRPSMVPLASTGPEGSKAAEQQSLFIFGVGYVATAIALTYLRKGWTVHGTCTDPRKVKSLGDQGIKVCVCVYM